MHAARVVGLIFALLASGCAEPPTPQPDAAPTNRAPQPEATAAAPAVPQPSLPVAKPPAAIAVAPAPAAQPRQGRHPCGHRKAESAAAGPCRAGATAPRHQSHRRPHQAHPQESDRRPAGPIPRLLPGEAQDQPRRSAAVLRSAGPQGALAAAGQRPGPGHSDRRLARGDLGHSFGSGEVRDDLIRRGRRTMRTPTTALAIAILAAACVAAPSLAADDESTRKDLFTVITLHGLPCGEVVSVTTRGRQRSRRVMQGWEPLPRLPQRRGARGCPEAMRCAGDESRSVAH